MSTSATIMVVYSGLGAIVGFVIGRRHGHPFLGALIGAATGIVGYGIYRGNPGWAPDSSRRSPE